MGTLLNLKHGKATFVVRSDTINIDNGSGTTLDYVLGVFPVPVKVKSVRAVYQEATDTAGAASANFTVGTAVAGAQIVAATALEVSKAVGSYTEATIVDGEVPANTMIVARHTGIAVTEAGTYVIQVELTVMQSDA